MTIMEAIWARHSVRKYTDEPLSSEQKKKLLQEIDACNLESGLKIQLITDEPNAFKCLLARFGRFSGVKNYIALVGATEMPSLDEKVGYYGERLVILAQQLGLNTCWVAATYSKRKAKVKITHGEKMVCVISVGVGQDQGTAHRSKPIDSVCDYRGKMPEWFAAGMEASLLAPTALNQQKFKFSLAGDRVKVVAGSGSYAAIDLGVVKYHFEVAAGQDNFLWS